MKNNSAELMMFAERKHFPEKTLTNLCNERTFVRCRRYIPHGYCTRDDLRWKPHNMALDPKYTDFGLDWCSSLRYVEPYCDEQRKDEKLWPEHCSHMRTFSGPLNHGMSPEWLLYTNGYKTGKRCLFAGNHRRSQHCAEEFDLSCDEIMKRQVSAIDQHNGIQNPFRPGDKPYRAVEYSPDFYKLESAVPKTQFGRLSHLPKPCEVPLFPVEKTLHTQQLRHLDEQAAVKREIADLDRWTPSPPFAQAIYTVTFPRK
ncbi:hypothetical protein P879_02396 [Paragonimus westermani]|uniref:Uncharacterized protein n=1 Tax=Paragonimus westermani TaxID=34504 RepID=A0A8T0DDI7_9TREM|nr:hypothetical protein P879_02396 [Paragonimus westermani]